MRKLQMFRAMIAAAVLCIAGTGAAEAVCTVTNITSTLPTSIDFNATKPTATQYEYKLGFTPVGCNTNYSVEIYLSSPAAQSKGLSVALPDKTTIGGYFSTLIPSSSVPVTATLETPTSTRSLFSQTVSWDGSPGSISMYYNINVDSQFGLFKPGLYTRTLNASIYIRDNVYNTVTWTGITIPMNVYIQIGPTAWLDLSSNKLDFGELTYGGVAKDPIYVYAYTNVQYALSFKSDNGWFLKTSPTDTVGVGYTIDFSSPLWDPYSPVPRAYFNVGGTSVGIQGPKLTGKITTDPTLLPAGTYTDTLTITLDINP